MKVFIRGMGVREMSVEAFRVLRSEFYNGKGEPKIARKGWLPAPPISEAQLAWEKIACHVDFFYHGTRRRTHGE